MLGSLGSFGSLLKQAKQIQSQLAGLGDELRAKRATGAAGGGLVELEVNGLLDVMRCKIDPSLLVGGDRELLEDLVCAAANQAIEKAKELHGAAMRNLAGGSLPGLDDALANLGRPQNRPGPLSDGEGEEG